MVLPQKVCKTYMTLLIYISLTKKGLENYKGVILRTLKYIKILQGKEINKRFYYLKKWKAKFLQFQK